MVSALCVSFGGSLSILHTFYQHFYACKTHILPLRPYVYLNVLKKKKSHGAGAAEVKQTYSSSLKYLSLVYKRR